jgi:hypothetical protein
MLFVAILKGTPVWVWALLLGLVALGVSQTFARRVSLLRSALMPVVMLTLSLQSVATGFANPPLALLAWAVGAAVAAMAVLRWMDVSAVAYDPALRCFDLPGSGWPLVLMLGIFAMKYGMGVSLALHPELRSSTDLALASSAAFGVFSGVFLGRTLALWVRVRPVAGRVVVV